MKRIFVFLGGFFALILAQQVISKGVNKLGSIFANIQPKLVHHSPAAAVAHQPTGPINVLNGASGTIDTNTLVVYKLPLHGTVTLSKNANGKLNGKITYQSTGNYSGLDSFYYKVCSGGTPDLCATEYQVVRIIPIINMDNTTILVNQSTGPFDVLKNDIGNFDTTTLAILTPPTNGSAVLELKGGKFDGKIIYTPNPGFSGHDQVKYQIQDKAFPPGSGVAQFAIDILPKLNNFQDSTFAGVTAAPVRVLSGGIGVLTSVNIPTQPANGTATVNGANQVIYRPNANYSGIEQYKFSGCGNGVCNTGFITVYVFPKTNPDQFTLKSQAMSSLDVLANDKGNIYQNGLMLTKAPVNGTATVVGGRIRYQSSVGFSGLDSLTYQACDKVFPSLCGQSLVKILVGPNANADTVSVKSGVPKDSIDVLHNDFGHLDTASLKIIAKPAHGTATSHTDGTLNYHPVNGYIGLDSLVYQICSSDSIVLCDQATVLFRVGQNSVDLQVTKTAPQTGVVGHTLTYTLQVVNNGPDSAHSVTLTDVLPASVDFIQGSIMGGASYDPYKKAVVFSETRMQKGYSKTIQFQVTINQSTAIVNTATITTPDVDRNPANDTSSVSTVATPPVLAIPNAFTPNGDGINDRFVIPGLELYPDNTIEIFNRWGNVVYQKTGYGVNGTWWDGAGLSEGTYYFYLKINIGGVPTNFKKYLTLKRSY